MFKLFFVITILFSFSCLRNVYVDNQSKDKKSISTAGKHKNICKELKGKTIIYCIFVNDKSANFWSNFDIKKSKEAIEKSASWIREKALAHNIELNLQTVYHTKKDTVVHPIEKNLRYKSINNHLFYALDGMEKLEKWSNDIAVIANDHLKKSNKIKLRTAESRDDFISNLREVYQAENIALVYLLNNMVREESSVALFTKESSSNDKTTEYAIISDSKKSTVITHEILHLFGADDFHTVNYQTIRLPKKLRKKYKRKYVSVMVGANNKTYVLREYPNAIMKNVQLDVLDSLEITPITKYLIGWDTKYNVTTKDKEFMLYGDYINIP